jgi:transglutaminase-like putative cysteine protease
VSATASKPEPRPREMNFAIRYLSRYTYDADVVDNLNALRVRPATDGHQRVDEFSVRLTPDARLQRHEDYFGTEVVEFEVSRPHHELIVDVRTRVSTQPAAEPLPVSWEQLHTSKYREAGGEFLFQTETAPEHPLLLELVAQTSGAPDPLTLVLSVCDLIPDRFEYRRGATYVDSPLSAVLDGAAGVCQDFVHLALHLLRQHGVAARYVSGYLFSSGGTGVADRAGAGDVADGSESVEVDTHAWIEVLLPDSTVAAEDPKSPKEPVWVGADPTNRGLTGERHVKIGHGRHYADVPPIKGVYRGMANSLLEARVTITRLDGAD